MSARRLVGLLILLIAALGAMAYTYVDSEALPSLRDRLGIVGLAPRFEPVTLRGLVAGDKISFLEDPETRAFLKNRYGIELRLVRAASLEMVQGSAENVDFLWPGGQAALDIYKAQNRPLVREEIVLNSPLVFYSWDAIVNALEANGLARNVEGAYYTIDLAALTSAMFEGRTWADLGVAGIHGRVRVAASHPARSSVGNQFAGLLANTINSGEVVDEVAIAEYLPSLRHYFSGLGTLPNSGTDLFAQYLREGAGAYPLVAGYEHQLVAFAVKNRSSLPAIREKVRVLYPRPTVWSTHPLIVVNDQASRLADALLHPEAQRIAGTKDGFRTGLGGTWRDPAALPIGGLAPTVDSVVGLPDAAVLKRIADEFSQQ